MARPVPQKTAITFRALASTYILYLAYTLIRDFGDIPENQRIGFVLIIAAFIVIPLFFFYTCWRDWKTVDAAEKAAAAEAAQQPAFTDDELDDEAEDELELAELSDGEDAADASDDGDAGQSSDDE